jgi:LysM repeat protein
LESQNPLELSEPAPPDPLIGRLRRRLWIERGFFSAVLLAIGTSYAYPRLYPDAWAVYLDGRPVTAAKSRPALTSALQRVEAAYAKNPTASAVAARAQIRRVDPARVPLTDLRSAESRLRTEWQSRLAQAVIYIDGDAVVALPDQADAESVLDRVKAAYSVEGLELETPPTFKEKVEVRLEPASDEIRADADAATALLKGEGAEKEGTHEVEDGETAWTIARRYELSVSDLKQLNPGVNLGRLHLGDRLVVSDAAAPPLTVVADARKVRDVLVDFPTEVRRSPQMFLGKRVLQQPGKPGRGQATYRVHLENGKPQSEEIVKREVLSPPQAKIVVLGSKPRHR